MNYVALDQYTKDDIVKISDVPSIDGVVLGDLYCNKRMFEFSDHELIDFARLARGLGIHCVYQTPRYLTERNFERVMQLVQYLQKECLIEKVIVQDVGATSYIRRMCPDLPIIWGYMGISRNGAENLLIYSFLRDNGITEIETDRVTRIPYLLELGLEVLLMQEHVTYKTVNRECYYMHEKEIYDRNCRRMCLKSTSALVNEKCGFDFSIDGYTLGKQYEPLDERELSACRCNDRITRALSLAELLCR